MDSPPSQITLMSNSLLITEENSLLTKKFGKSIKKQFYRSVNEVKQICNYFLIFLRQIFEMDSLYQTLS